MPLALIPVKNNSIIPTKFANGKIVGISNFWCYLILIFSRTIYQKSNQSGGDDQACERGQGTESINGCI